MVAEGLEMVEFRAGQEVFCQGDPGDRFYIVREGTGRWREGTCGEVGSEGGARSGSQQGMADLAAAHVGRGVSVGDSGIWRSGTRVAEEPPGEEVGRQGCGGLAAPSAGLTSGTCGCPAPCPLPSCLTCPLAAAAAVVLARVGQEVGRKGEGSFFGELALVNNEPRTATAYGAAW